MDGLYVIRTSVSAEALPPEQTVAAYKSLSQVEWAFRSLKSVDLKVRPIYHWKDDRIKSHVLLCMLAYYVEWHLRGALADLLFDDHEREAAEADRKSIVSPAPRSAAAQRKDCQRRTPDGLAVQSYVSAWRRSQNPEFPPPSEFAISPTFSPQNPLAIRKKYGLSNTLLVGEKCLSVDNYLTGEGYGDDQSMYIGDDADIRRWADLPPIPDRARYDDIQHFGGPHGPGSYFVLGDGSVRVVAFRVDYRVFRALGNRHDGQAIVLE